MMLNRILATLAAAVCAGGIAWAGAGTVLYTSSGTATFATTTTGGGANLSNVTIWDSAAGANGLAVNASGQLTISNATFASTQSGTWTVQPGNTANTTPWLATVNNGGNSAAVKAASTAAVAADPALVVAISPNNALSVSQTGTWTVQPGNTANTTA